MPDDYERDDFSKVEKMFEKLKDKSYSLLDLEDVLQKIEQEAISNNYEFANVLIDQEIIDNNKINFKIKIIEGEKFFVERINIRETTILKRKL